METNIAEVFDRRQASEIKKNINFTEKRLDELQNQCSKKKRIRKG